jgi:hypothetical protein
MLVRRNPSDQHQWHFYHQSRFTVDYYELIANFREKSVR